MALVQPAEIQNSFCWKDTAFCFLPNGRALLSRMSQPQGTRGAKEGFDREDPALAGFLNVPSGKTCSSDVLRDWGTLWEFLSCTYTASVHPSALHYCQHRIWPQNCTSSCSPAQLLCRYTRSQSPHTKIYFLLSHEMYLIQDSQ